MLLLPLAACQQPAPAAPLAKPRTVAAVNGEDSGALSSDARPDRLTVKANVLKGTNWPALRLTSGVASVHCDREDRASAAGAATGNDGGLRDADQARPDQGVLLADLGFFGVVDALLPCKESGLLRLRYKGKIDGDFTAMVQRVAAMSERMSVHARILDIDSTGGRVEDAMRAGDAMAEAHWAIRVRPDAICHSACVLVLAAGDERDIDGKIGIHRMVRIDSKADTRAELSQELREVYDEMKQYLERNGASVAVADLMMTVPNRSLRLLSENELREYGLSGANAAQDDLDRIRLTRECGGDFVKRKDAFARAFDRECVDAGAHAGDTHACGLALRERYGFPGQVCARLSPLSGHE